MNNYYQIRASIDSKYIGTSNSPITVEISNDFFSKQSRKYILNVNDYFAEQLMIYDNFPKNLKGKIIQKKNIPIDIMNVIPFYMSIEFAVSEKVVNILKDLSISNSEYYLEKFTIEGINDTFYFLFIPILKSDDYIDFSQSIFIDDLSNKEIIFGSYDDYRIKSMEKNYLTKHLFIPNELKNRDIISLQKGKPYFSERIINAFQDENVLGYEIIRKGESQINLHFI